MEWDRRAEVLRLRRHREGFSRLGWALTAQMAVMLAAQTLLLLLARFLAPGLAERGAFLWLVSALSAYGAGVPAFCLALRGTEAPPPRSKVALIFDRRSIIVMQITGVPP